VQTAVLLAFLQISTPGGYKPVYERPINQGFSVVLTSVPGEKGSTLAIALRERRSKQLHPLAQIFEESEAYKLIRVDDSTLVVEVLGFYMAERRVKLFYDLASKSLLKQVDYPPRLGLDSVEERAGAQVLDLPEGLYRKLLEKAPWTKATENDLSYLPKEMQEHPMPRSSYAEFARARPQRVEDGYVEDGTYLEEQPGPFQVLGSRIWFGKVFYDGEGHTGVGGLGYFDTATSCYTFVPVPQLAEWQATALLVEDDVAWIGLSSQPEGEEYAGGLLRYDLRTKAVRKEPVEEVISQIVRYDDRLYLATTNGVYELQGDRLVNRYRVEPDRDGRTIILKETLSRSK
jgi:hypothetical protein